MKFFTRLHAFRVELCIIDRYIHDWSKKKKMQEPKIPNNPYFCSNDCHFLFLL